MVDYADIYFAPDIDSNWSRAPGALTEVEQFAPLQAGHYGSMGTASVFSLTGSNHYIAYAFRKVAGTVRFLTFRAADIDEYDSSGTRTNRGTGYTGGMWSAAAWGDQIIATNYTDAVQSSTGAGFTALSGTPPKARMVAANANFVMLGDTNDGSNQYPDQVWWSGIRNPNTWTASPATQAGYKRLTEIPGPLRALVPFRDKFVAFKDNGFYVGEYIGPPYVFGWRVVSQRVGAVGMHSVAELDGKLYFLHTSGFWEFDGQGLRNVGLPVFQSFLSESGFIAGGGFTIGSGAAATGNALSLCQTAVDDIDGVVWFNVGYYFNSGTQQVLAMYGYNPRSGKWGRYTAAASNMGTGLPPVLVRATSADMQAFKADSAARIWIEGNGTSNALRAIRYPVATTDLERAKVVTGMWGDAGQSTHTTSVYLRHIRGSDTLAINEVTGTISGYGDEAQLITASLGSSSYNAEKVAIEGNLDANYKQATVRYVTAKKIILGGVALDDMPAGRRNRRG